jgi:predicted RNA-binding Zn ribbon-like protein
MKKDWACLEFTKTAGWQHRDRPDDEFQTYHDVVAWCRNQGLIDEFEASQCSTRAERNPEEADRALRQAVELRELLYRTFSRVGSGEEPDAHSLEALNGLLPRALTRLRLNSAPGGIIWGWRWEPPELDRILAPLIHSAAELLTSDELSRVRLCDGDGCGWLFVDRSRNQSRRWCDMGDCGNRAKARRFRERSKAPPD